MHSVLLQPPSVFKLLAHEVRWNLLQYLARSDYRVAELVHKLALPQNLVSYHLRQLAKEHLVMERRSSADERSIYYSLDLERLHTLFLAAGEVLHPVMGSRTLDMQEEWPLHEPPLRVLFLCTENSARSLMAEALLRHLSHGSIEACSAGSQPALCIHPLAVRAMNAVGLDMNQQYPKHVDAFQGRHFDAIITVCDRMRETCPAFPDDAERIHWSFPDPAVVKGSEEECYRAFEQISQQLSTRIRLLLTFLAQESSRCR